MTTLDELAPYAEAWDRLSAGIPFRSWTWMSTWWRHYGDEQNGRNRRTRLHVLAVFDRADMLVGVAPWYLDVSAAQGRVLRFLGSGEVCSDHLSLLCPAGLEERVTEALAGWLTGQRSEDSCGRQPDRWDLVELTGVDADDPNIAQLLEQLEHRGNTVHRRPGPNCWQIELPPDWDDYLARLSKSHRKQLRRLDRDMLSTGRAVFHTVERIDQLPQAMDMLIDLHQRRHRSQGEPGCFASSRFTGFHREVAGQLLSGGHLQLHWLELDGKPAAAEYQLAGNGAVYAYQSGIEPEMTDLEPGRLITLATIRRAVRQGYRAFDFLRGDEPYKPHWRAVPQASQEIRVVPNRTVAQLRHGLWRTGSGARQWIRDGLKRVAERGESR